MRTALSQRRDTGWAWLLLISLLGLGLRLLVWHWHEAYPLGGDETEYFNQALIFLREHRYVELKLMRPPLYTGFLAVCMYLFDSLVQRLRLIQVLISTLTLLPIYVLAQQLFAVKRVALLAALLAALCYTLADHANELLTETLFLFGLSTLFVLLLAVLRTPAASGRRAVWLAAFAGVNIGVLVLVRSVALPLLPLGALWLLFSGRNQPDRFFRPYWLITLTFVIAAVLVIAPWTLRNYRSYGALIIVDTTGAENLWLDNNPDASMPGDPLGREAAKRQLYALGTDQAARQRLATAHGLAAIRSHPAWFVAKTWGEAKRFFALEYFDDLRTRRAIWVPPLEVWLRVLCGDGMWLLLVLAGTVGVWRASHTNATVPAISAHWLASTWATRRDPRWLFVPWALYTLLTALVFHVELRYRLPLYPVLLPYTAWVLNALFAARQPRYIAQRIVSATQVWALFSCIVILALTLLHRAYVADSWMLARKHLWLWQADRALVAGNPAVSANAANQALALDPDSVLARIALARAAMSHADRAAALAELDAAIAVLNAHPQPHLLRGAILRAQGDLDAARQEFRRETDSLQDLQSWSWDIFAALGPPPAVLNVGQGLDLGYLRGFWPADADGFRWSRAESELRLGVTQGPDMRLTIRLNGMRPVRSAPAQVTLLVNGSEIGRVSPVAAWQRYSFMLPASLTSADQELVLTIRSNTFRPRSVDPASPDNRALGVMVGQVELHAP